jgi:hypothetical protein
VEAQRSAGVRSDSGEAVFRTTGEGFRQFKLTASMNGYELLENFQMLKRNHAVIGGLVKPLCV